MAHDKDHIAGLAKGLQILSAFNGAYTRLTQSQAARLVGITPAAAVAVPFEEMAMKSAGANLAKNNVVLGLLANRALRRVTAESGATQ